MSPSIVYKRQIRLESTRHGPGKTIECTMFTPCTGESCNGRLRRAMGPHLPPARTPSGAPAPGPLAPPPAPDTATRQEPTQRAGRDLVTPLADRALHHWLGSAGVLRGCIWELKFCRRHARDVERDLAVLSCSLSCCTTFVRTFSLHAMRRRGAAFKRRTTRGPYIFRLKRKKF